MESAIRFTLLLLLALATATPADTSASWIPNFWLKMTSSRLASAFDMEEATVAGIKAALDDGRLNSTQLVQHYLDQISAANPSLHAVLEVNPDALSDAARADSQRATIPDSSRSPLYGIPILVKDNIATRDRLNTTSGSLALLGSVVPRDAGVIVRLRQAGAIILGKATMSEWDNFRSLSLPHGWSPRGGQGKNPYPGSDNPCGTSSGSAIAVAANLVTVALGTDLNAAITCPAAVNSVVGIKPTVGLTSRSGIVPISRRLDTVGPIARTVADAVAVLDVIAGFDAQDMSATWAGEKFIPVGGFRKFLNEEGLKDKRIGILSGSLSDFGEKSVELSTFTGHFDVMRKKGATLITDLNLPDLEILLDLTQSGQVAALLAEFKVSLEEYLRDLVSSPVRTLADVIAFNDNHPKEERMDEFGHIIFLASNKTNGLGVAETDAINKMIQLSKESIDRVMKENNLDAFAYPNDQFDNAFSIGGLPIISVPAGYSDSGSPFGISFCGSFGSDAKLIEIAYAYEQATRVRKAPPRSL